jgi:hypothetical protein
MVLLLLTTWYTDGSCMGGSTLQVAMGYQVDPKKLWYKPGYGQMYGIL